MPDEGYLLTYTVHLDDLNQITAQFAAVHEDRIVRFSLPRIDWERMGRPGRLTLGVES